MNTYVDNIFGGLTKETREQFERGDGNELQDDGNKAKMKALHSSSALCVNVFQYFQRLLHNGNSDSNVIALACKMTIDHDIQIEDITFEDKFPIISNSMSPNIDVVIKSNKGMYAIESKFCEPFNSHGKAQFNFIKNKYLENKEIWRQIPETKKCIDGLDMLTICKNDGSKIEGKQLCTNRYLDCAQLLKHILGLLQANKSKKAFRLIYVWYDVYGYASSIHRKEITDFKELLKKDNINFTAITYQEIIYNLNKLLVHKAEHKEYLDYLNERYI